MRGKLSCENGWKRLGNSAVLLTKFTDRKKLNEMSDFCMQFYTSQAEKFSLKFRKIFI